MAGPAANRRATLLIAVVILLLMSAGISLYSTGITPADAAEWLQETRQHWWTPFAFIGVYVFFALVFIPPFPLSITATVIWGWLLGGFYEWIAATLGAILPYLLARRLLAEWVSQRLEQRFSTVAEKLRREGFMAILLVRLVPVIPYIPLNFLAGATGIRPLHYFVATAFGMIPSIFIFTFLVESLIAGVVTPGQAFARVLLAGLLFAILVLATRWLASRLRRRGENDEA
jgi:uncharacterized membrane protein YdjX (TVP38/TMEM64 family)